MGGPTFFAKKCAFELGIRVTRMDIHRQLRFLNYSRKKRSIVPALADASERRRHLRWFNLSGVYYDQVVWIDEKKFYATEIPDRCFQYGYSPVGERIPRQSALVHGATQSFRRFEVIAGLCSFRDDDHWGLGAFEMAQPKLSTSNILNWLFTRLPRILTPFPGPRSVVVLDNMPTHRAHQRAIEYYINRVGAVVIWNPPNSPDLNPIENMWNMLLSRICQLHEAAIIRGAAGITIADVDDVLTNTRVNCSSVNHAGFHLQTRP